MVRRFVALMLVTLGASSAAAVPTVRAMFVDAMAKEEAVRAALADQQTTENVLKAVRDVVRDYETLVRTYPNSSYSDDALWQAGRLSLDAYSRFRQPRDQEAGVRLLRWLQSEYPSSKLAKQASGQLPDSSGPPIPPIPAERSASSPAAAPKPAIVAPGSGPASPAPAVAPSAGVPAASVATIKAIRRVAMPDVVRVIIEMDKEMPFHEERIAGPSRIFVDFQSTRTVPALVDQTLRFDGDSDVVKQVRIGRHPNATRVVLDAAGVSSYSVYPLYSPYRLVIDCVRSTAAPQASTVSGDQSAERPKWAAVATPQVADRPKPVAAAPLAAVERPKAAATTAPATVERQKATQAPPPAERKPLVGRRLVGQAGGIAPFVTPSGSAALRAARADETLAGRRLGPLWQGRLPAVAPLRTGEIAESFIPPLLASRALRRDWDRPLPSTMPAGSALIADLEATSADGSEPPPITSVEPAAKPALPSPAPAASPTRPGFSIARQLGLNVSRIVIDPGHGGHDPGAQSKGVSEAELVLDIAQRLQHLLEAVPGVEVVLTRQTDDFVSLQERTAIANRESADLFLSIHANASDNAQAHGVETYFLNFANTLSAAQVAARENAASGQAMNALPDFVKAIALHNKLDESRDFATLVQAALLERLRPVNKTLRNLGVKQAPFVVLIGASMPSVLAEISFLTNPQEAKLLKSDAYRDRIAEALFNGVRKYQASLTRVQTVAHQ